MEKRRASSFIVLAVTQTELGLMTEKSYIRSSKTQAPRSRFQGGHAARPASVICGVCNLARGFRHRLEEYVTHRVGQALDIAQVVEPAVYHKPVVGHDEHGCERVAIKLQGIVTCERF